MPTRICNGDYTIYVHINNINGKVYVGITCQRPIERWGHNGIGYKKQNYFWKAIQKYGWNNFEHVIFAERLTLDEACNMEKIMIKELQANESNHGYNIHEGGLFNGNEIERYNRLRKQISKSCSGKRHRCYGKHLSEETKRKISESEKGRKKAPNAGTQPIPILCVETGIVYPSTAEASRSLGVHHSSITMVLKGRRQRAGNYHWKYYDATISNNS